MGEMHLAGPRILRAHRSSVRSICVSQSGLQLLSGDDEGFVILWSLESRRPKVVWKAHDNALLTTKFWQINSDEPETLIVTHARDNKLRIWKNPFPPGSNDSKSTNYSTSPLPYDQNAVVKDLQKPWLVYTQDINAMNFCSVDLSSSGVFAGPATIASECIDIYSLDANFMVSRPFKALDASQALPLETQLEAEEAQTSRRGLLGAVMVLRIEGDALFAGYESGYVVKFNINTGEVELIVQTHKAPILSIALDSNIAFVSAANRDVVLLDLKTGKTNTAAQFVHRGVASVDVLQLPLHTILVTAGWDGTLSVFSMERDKEPDIRLSFEYSSEPKIGATSVCIHIVEAVSNLRRLRRLPLAWVVLARKDGRILLHEFSYNTMLPSVSRSSEDTSPNNLDKKKQ